MPRFLHIVSLLALCACAAQSGAFKDRRFESARYPYGVYFAGNGPEELVSRDWRLGNYYPQAATSGQGFDEPASESPSGTAKLKPKRGPEYEVTRHYDSNGDGVSDIEQKEPFYDLLLEHRHKDAELWVRMVPFSAQDREKELRVIAERYIEAASGSGSIAVRFGAEGPVGVVEKRFATRVLGTSSCKVSAREAWLVEFEVANVDQLQLSEAARWRRGRLVIVRPKYTYEIVQGTRKAEFPVLMLVGFSAAPQDFAELAPDFDKLLGQIALGTDEGELPFAGGHSCRSATRGGDGSTPSPAASAGSLETQAAIPADAPAEGVPPATPESSLAPADAGALPQPDSAPAAAP